MSRKEHTKKERHLINIVYCSMDYKRRKTLRVNVGNIPMGADFPIRVQSMTSTSTMDTDGSVAQCRRIYEAGADYVRLTAQGVREANNIGEIRSILRKDGCPVPLIADIHFNPSAAYAAAKVADKVRINPGNFVDAARTFKTLTYTDEEYAVELQRIHDALVPFIELCKENHTAVRLGVNHGSLSDRIMSRYGDTPEGMVESVMEFLRVFVSEDFHDVVISIKASNTVVMVETVRLMAKTMDEEGLHYPLHIGVTEAGDGEDGRIKSAVGIGALLAEGIGDTIRVSLSEDPELEIPVARKLVEYITSREGHPHIEGGMSRGYDWLKPERRATCVVGGLVGGNKLPVTVVSSLPSSKASSKFKADFHYVEDGNVPTDADARFIVPFDKYADGAENIYPLFTLEEAGNMKDCSAAIKWLRVASDTDVAGGALDFLRESQDVVLVVTPANINVTGCEQAFLHALADRDIKTPAVIMNCYPDSDDEWLQVKTGADFGTVLLNGFRDGIWLVAPNYADDDNIVRYEYSILQAARLRMSKTEFISCPGCGRTMYDLQTTVHKVKEATSHLTHLKIGIMGCIVNGPGEMADADYGYVGAGVNRVSLYKGKECVEKNILEEEAIPRLIALIKSNGDWVEP